MLCADILERNLTPEQTYITPSRVVSMGNGQEMDREFKDHSTMHHYPRACYLNGTSPGREPLRLHSWGLAAKQWRRESRVMGLRFPLRLELL